MLELTGKIALVTGASRGIGRAIALSLARQGATVVAAARADNAAQTVAAITEAGGRAEAVSVDVTDASALEALPSGIVARHGRLDILVSNAGITRDQLLMRMKREDWDAVIATNLTATFTLTQAAMRPMLKQRGGRIIVVSSVVGQMGNAGQTNYAASKAGLIGFAKALAREVALARHHGERGGPGHGGHRHDARHQRQGADRPGRTDSARAARFGGGHRFGDLLPCVRRGSVYYRTRPGGQRRHVHVGRVFDLDHLFIWWCGHVTWPGEVGRMADSQMARCVRF